MTLSCSPLVVQGFDVGAQLVEEMAAVADEEGDGDAVRQLSVKHLEKPFA